MARIRNKEALKSIALAIKKIRKEKGITQEDFLFDAGIHMGRIEMGNNDMSCSTLIAVCDKLRISPVYLFAEYEKIMPKNPGGSNHLA